MEHTKTATVTTTRTHTIRLTRADLLALLPKKLRDAATRTGSSYRAYQRVHAIDYEVGDGSDDGPLVLEITEQVTR